MQRSHSTPSWFDGADVSLMAENRMRKGQSKSKPAKYPRPQQLADFAKAHLPTMHAFRVFVDAGGLMSYGASTFEIYTNAAEQVAKIQNGARPSDLPLRQATRFELVINNRTAKALGITIPPTLLERADEVID